MWTRLEGHRRLPFNLANDNLFGNWRRWRCVMNFYAPLMYFTQI